MRPELNTGRLAVWLTAILLVGTLFNACEPSKSKAILEPESGPISNGDGAIVKSKANTSDRKKQDQTTVKAEVEIKIENFVFDPPEATVAPGTRITWINKDEAPHTATSTDDKFNSGGLDTDDKYSFVFNEKGDYAYFCALHPHMKAVIRVR